MRCNENYARQDLNDRAPKKKTHKVMPLNQRLLLEALMRRKHASIRAVAEDLEKSRDVMKHVFAALESQGYVERVGKTPSSRGRALDLYKWTGKRFPSSAEMAAKAEADVREVAASVAVLVAGMQAMCRVGRTAA